MLRVIVGSVVSAIAMFAVSFIFFATPLYRLAIGNLDDARAAAVRDALAVSIPSTGTYHVPLPTTDAQTVMYGQGPLATIHYNISGASASDPTVIVGGLLLGFLTALLMGTALIGIDRRVPDFGSRARLVIFFSVGIAAFMTLGNPIMFHSGWGYFIYMFVADALTLCAGGLVLARWFLPAQRSAPADAPTEV